MLTADDVSGDSEGEWCGAVRGVAIVTILFQSVIVPVAKCDMSDMLFACSRCFSRHPFEELSQGQQLCKVSGQLLRNWRSLKIYTYTNLPNIVSNIVSISCQYLLSTPNQLVA